MLSKDVAGERAKLIRPDHANCEALPAELTERTRTGNDTIYMSAIDRDGNIVSLIQSNYSAFGTGMVAPGTGFALHNRGGLFTLKPGEPNTLGPRKRPLHTIIPAFMEKDSHAHRIRNHGRMEPGAGARAVCCEYRRFRDEHPDGDGSRALH